MQRINWINVSGGKDSTPLLLWSLEQELPNCRYVYADTGHEHPSVYEYLDYLEEKTGVNIERIGTDGFLEMCIKKRRFPSTQVRFCTEELKIIPLAKHMDSIEESSKANQHMIWVGIRAEESDARRKMPEVLSSNVKYPPRKTSWQLRHHPLLDWSVQDVFDIHKKHNIKPNPLYKMGMSRVGCFPCIMARQSEMRKIFKVSPETIDRIEEWERQVSAVSKTGVSTLIAVADLPKGVPAGIRAYAEYLDSGPELPGLEQDFTGCMSVYGLCE